MMFDVKLIDRNQPENELPQKAKGACDWCHYPGIELVLFVGGHHRSYVCDFCLQGVGSADEDTNIILAQQAYAANKIMATLMLVVKKERVTDPEDLGVFVVGKISASRGFMLVGHDGRPFVCNAENQLKVFNEICTDASMYRVSSDGTHLSRVSTPQDPTAPVPPMLKMLTADERVEVGRAISTLED